MSPSTNLDYSLLEAGYSENCKIYRYTLAKESDLVYMCLKVATGWVIPSRNIPLTTTSSKFHQCMEVTTAHRSWSMSWTNTWLLIAVCRPTERGGGGKQGILPRGPQTCFEERGPTRLLKLIFVFTILGCILTIFLFLLLSIALSGLNEWTLK